MERIILNIYILKKCSFFKTFSRFALHTSIHFLLIALIIRIHYYIHHSFVTLIIIA